MYKNCNKLLPPREILPIVGILSANLTLYLVSRGQQSGFVPMSDRFLAQVEATLKDPAGQLYTTSAALLARFTRKQVEVLLDRLQGQKPSLLKAMMNDQQKPTPSSPSWVFTDNSWGPTPEPGFFATTIENSVSSVFNVNGYPLHAREPQ